jgi:hypothetical protein
LRRNYRTQKRSIYLPRRKRTNPPKRKVRKRAKFAKNNPVHHIKSANVNASVKSIVEDKGAMMIAIVQIAEITTKRAIKLEAPMTPEVRSEVVRNRKCTKKITHHS